MWAWLSEFIQAFVGFVPRPLIVRTDQRTVEFVFGRWPRLLEPGWYIEWPAVAGYETIPVKLQIISRSQRFGCHAFRWKVVYTIEDPLTLVTECYDFEETIADMVEIAVGDYLRQNPQVDIASKESREKIRRALKKRLAEYGVEIKNWSVSSWSKTDAQISVWELQEGSWRAQD